ncbi:MAG TPA: lipoate--protein ligase family protein [Geobacteraceae bacterium]|nr:lipoate--protein ligase family protein [Geobacteraceae bacterium]
MDTGPLDGPTNMALDEALLTSFDPAVSSPVFRLYGWNPPAFSIGRFQDADKTLDSVKCRDAGIDTVRRMTGGGLIYHADEITYSIVCAQKHISGISSVKETFRKLCAFLLHVYRKLGLDAAFAVDRNFRGARLGRRTAICFAGKEEYDIIVEGRKIGGNAQRRIREVIFQHGSIPLSNCLGEAMSYVLESEKPALLEQETASLGELGFVPDSGKLKNILAESFENNLEVSLIPSGPKEDELRTMNHLRERKYSSAAWNREGICD